MADNKKLTKSEIEKIINAVEAVKYGSVNIIIQDGRIVQIEKNEKFRMV